MIVAERTLAERVVALAEARLGRELTAGERHIDLLAGDAALERGKKELEAAIVAEYDRAVNRASRGQVPRLEVTERMVVALERLANTGARHAKAELRSMGIEPLPPIPRGVMFADELGKLRRAAAIRPTLDFRLRSLLDGIRVRVAGEFRAAAISGEGFEAVARSLKRKHPGALDMASRLISGAYISGVGRIYEENADLFGAWQYSAVMDAATCDVCRALDGTVYATLDELLRVLPNFGPNPSCFGDGRCRCRGMPAPPDADAIPPDRQVAPPDDGEDALVISNPDEGADAFVTGLRRTERDRGKTPDESRIAEARKNFREKIARSIDPDTAARARVALADAYNRQSALHRAATAKFGRDRILVIKDGPDVDSLLSPGRDVAAAQRMSGNRVTVVRHEATEVRRTGPISPGDNSTLSSGGLEALLRHEYGHQINDSLTPDQKAAFRALLPSDRDELRRDLTLYGRTGFDVGNEQEAFSELYAIITDVDFDPDIWAEWVLTARNFIAELLDQPPIVVSRDVLQVARARWVALDDTTLDEIARREIGQPYDTTKALTVRETLDREGQLRAAGAEVKKRVDELVKASGVKTVKQAEATLARYERAWKKSSDAVWEVRESVMPELLAKHYGGRTLGQLTMEEYDALDGLIANHPAYRAAADKHRRTAVVKLEMARLDVRQAEQNIAEARQKAIATVLDDAGVKLGGDLDVEAPPIPTRRAELEREYGWDYSETARRRAVENVKAVARFLPSRWVNASNRRGKLYATEKQRGVYIDRDYDLGGALIGANNQQVALHEIAHRIEFALRELNLYTWAFRVRRTVLSRRASDRKLEKLKDLQPRHGYGDHETTYSDKFTNPYIGRNYGDRPDYPTEVLTMGLESVIYGRNDVWDKDPELRDLILGILAILG